MISDPNILDAFPALPSVETLASFLVPTQVRVAEDLRSPYSMQSSLKIERQFPLNFNLSAAWVRTRTLRALRSRNINAPLPPPSGTAGNLRPFGDSGEIFQYESSGVFDQNQLIITAVNKFGKRLSWYSTYIYGRANSDTEGPRSFPINTYDLSTEYGRSALDARHTFYWGGWITMPGGISLTPMFVMRSGLPFNIRIGRDRNGDSLFTERPSFATDTERASVVETAFGLFDLDPLLGQKIIPRNFGTGPAFFSTDLLLSKRFTLGGEIKQVRASKRRKQGKTKPKDSGFFNRSHLLRFSVQVSNLFNRVNPSTPGGNLSSPLFGLSTASAGAYGYGRHPGGNRAVTLQIHFEF